MTNDVPLREFMEMRFKGLETLVDQRLTGVELAVREQTVCIEDLDDKREANSKRIDGLEGFRKGAYYLGTIIITVILALMISGLTGVLF